MENITKELPEEFQKKILEEIPEKHLKGITSEQLGELWKEIVEALSLEHLEIFLTGISRKAILWANSDITPRRTSSRTGAILDKFAENSKAAPMKILVVIPMNLLKVFSMESLDEFNSTPTGILGGSSREIYDGFPGNPFLISGSISGGTPDLTTLLQNCRRNSR